MEHALEGLSLEDPQAEAPISTLPPELLVIIFGYTLPPAFLLDSSLSRGPESAWCCTTRMKKSIISVCKLWYNIGIPLLYQDIVFRRCTQIPALLRSFNATPGLSAFVKSVHVNCFFPRPMVNICYESMAKISQFCTQLLSLDLVYFMHGHWAGPNPLASIPVPNPQILVAFSCDTNIISSHPEAYWDSVRQSITELRLVMNTGVDYNLFTPTSLEFPRVESLQCYVQETEHIPKSFLDKLHVPSLHRLTIHADMDHLFGLRRSHIIMEFLPTCGSKLHYLNIGSQPFNPMTLDLALCPLLTHLVIGNNYQLQLKPYEHKNLQIIDVYEYEIEKIQRNLSEVDWSDFPNLKCVRRMDPASVVYHLPQSCSTTTLDYNIFYPTIEWGYQLHEVVYTKRTGWLHTWGLTNDNLFPVTSDDMEGSDASFDPAQYESESEPDEEYMDEGISLEEHDSIRRGVRDSDGDWHVNFATALEMPSETLMNTDQTLTE